MALVEIEIPDIPHGHGLSFKGGLADDILGSSEHQDLPHSPHVASYKRGVEVGRALKSKIAPLVKD